MIIHTFHQKSSLYFTTLHCTPQFSLPSTFSRFVTTQWPERLNRSYPMALQTNQPTHLTYLLHIPPTPRLPQVHHFHFHKHFQQWKNEFVFILLPLSMALLIFRVCRKVSMWVTNLLCDLRFWIKCGKLSPLDGSTI